MSSSTAFKVQNLYNVENWVCVVSGGGTGIGLMISQALANNGAKVYILGRRREVLEVAIKSHGSDLAHPSGQMIPIQTDITSKDNISNLVNELSKKEDHIDLLVNNAGISEGTVNVEAGDESAEALSKELFNDSWESWEKIYRTNVISYYFMSSAFLPLLSAATKKHPGRSAAVINISSISGITRTTQHHPSYNVSKAATIQLNTMLAQEFSRPGVKVRVNSIAPGIFPSEMTTEGSDDANKSHIPSDGYREKKQIPAGRPGKEEDMAQAALMLAVNDYCNGQTIAIDGGYLLGHP
ncbi:NAD(P)-binding protein [Clavulina sp. PMI_390]|nr:NAD(P)-binding protein [Clavulina sp. PMI_390]